MRQSLLKTAVLIGLASSAQAQLWTNGDGDQAWENGLNWDGGVVPQTGLTNINTATAGQTPIITTAVNLTAFDTFIGAGAGASGVLDINSGGSIDTSSKWIFVGDAGGTGRINVNSGGSMLSDNRIRLGDGGGAHGILNVDGGSISASQIDTADTSEIHISNGGSVTATAGNIQMRAGATASSLNGGSMTASGQIFIGNGGTGTAFDLNSGSMQSGAWFVVGLGGGVTGTLNMSGGTIDSSVGSGFTTIGAAGGTGVVNQTGGTWTETNKTVLGENAGGTGSYNLNGGVLQTGAVEKGAGAANLNFGGGTLRAGRDEANFINASTSVVINGGGGTIDSNGFNVSVNADITGAGALDKQGAGSLNLAGAGNSLDAVSVSVGTLFVSGALGTTSGIDVGAGASIGAGDPDGGTITGDLVINAGGTLDVTNGLLTISGGTVSFGSFGFGDIAGFDVNTAANGTYTLIAGDFILDSSNIANFGEENALDLGGGKSAYFGAGSLTAVVVPEPGIALLGGLGLLGLLRRRRG